MIGTIANAAGILIGGLSCLKRPRQLPPATQWFFKVGLGVFTVFFGLRLAWTSLNGGALHMLKQLGIALLAMSLGKLLGRLARLQKLSNRLGQYAKERMARVTPESPQRASDGFVVCSILYCVEPLAILGAVQDGLNNQYQLLVIKAVMDGLAAMAFVTMFGGGVLLSVLPVVAYQGLLTLVAQLLAQNAWLRQPGLLEAFNLTSGLLLFSVALIILELKRVAVADYLPALVLAPLLTWWWLL